MTEQASSTYRFSWANLGNLEEGRPNLGRADGSIGIPIDAVYPSGQVLETRYGSPVAREIFVEAGRRAGQEFCKNVLDTGLGINELIADLQAKLKSLNIGVLRVEKADLEKLEFVLTVSEDLDCSGLPLLGETVCDYDEGFIAGILDVYTGRPFEAKEIDCWANRRWHVQVYCQTQTMRERSGIIRSSDHRPGSGSPPGLLRGDAWRSCHTRGWTDESVSGLVEIANLS